MFNLSDIIQCGCIIFMTMIFVAGITIVFTRQNKLHKNYVDMSSQVIKNSSDIFYNREGNNTRYDFLINGLQKNECQNCACRKLKGAKPEEIDFFRIVEKCEFSSKDPSGLCFRKTPIDLEKFKAKESEKYDEIIPTLNKGVKNG